MHCCAESPQHPRFQVAGLIGAIARQRVFQLTAVDRPLTGDGKQSSGPHLMLHNTYGRGELRSSPPGTMRPPGCGKGRACAMGHLVFVW